MEVFEFLAEVRETDKQLQAVQKSIKELKKIDVLVGVPQEEAGREQNGITNAEFCIFIQMVLLQIISLLDPL